MGVKAKTGCCATASPGSTTRFSNLPVSGRKKKNLQLSESLRPIEAPFPVLANFPNEIESTPFGSKGSMDPGTSFERSKLTLIPAMAL